ncbi:hypothetical protein P5673_032228 [Acropora cervicornis]|uniref:Uncharacterized protein n=1 Tax=Acropora cervicornis TaxID=6130 RepID=A0AAD9PRH7_ACRCE|nr:hypothetical protein P5673_032228 [Acropora cervicornis]
MVSKILSLFSLFMCVRCFNPFDDGQYDISWGGPLTMNSGQVSPKDGDLSSNRESIVMITKDNEKYRCILPQEESKQERQCVLNTGVATNAMIMADDQMGHVVIFRKQNGMFGIWLNFRVT